MGANTTIQEGGKGRAFGPVVALMVQGNNQKYLPWVLESERQLDTKSVSKNGVYQAKKDGVYGWRSVYVNVPTDQGVTGTDPTTGQQVAVGTDPTTGELTETVVPTEIRIETPPMFTGPYGDRAYIDFSGLTVAAYGTNGNKMQDVPFNELIFPVTVTDINQVRPGEGERDVSGTDLNAPVYLRPLSVGMYFNNLLVKEVSGTVYGLCEHKNQFYEFGMAAYFPGTVVVVARDDGSYPTTLRPSTEFTYGGKTCFIGSAGTMSFTPRSSVAFSAAQKYGAAQTAGIALLGTTEIGGGQYVPVLWQCPGNGAVLETGFYVDVVDVNPNNNSGN